MQACIFTSEYQIWSPVLTNLAPKWRKHRALQGLVDFGHPTNLFVPRQCAEGEHCENQTVHKVHDNTLASRSSSLKKAQTMAVSASGDSALGELIRRNLQLLRLRAVFFQFPKSQSQF